MGRPRKNPVEISQPAVITPVSNPVESPPFPSVFMPASNTPVLPEKPTFVENTTTPEHKVLEIAKAVMAPTPTIKEIVAAQPIPEQTKFCRITTPNSPRFGLIDGVEYKYKKDGRIDWEAMFDPEYYIYPNNDGSKAPLLKVDGLRNLAEIRGIEWKRVEFQQTLPDMVVCKVTIKYIPNFEDPNGREWSAIADASAGNIGSGFAKYLATMAETRATGRCHREALGIRLCTFEEVSPDDMDKPSNDGKPIDDVTMAAIHRQMQLKGVTNEALIVKIQEKLPTVDSLGKLTQSQAVAVLNYLNTKQNVKSEVTN